MPKVTLVPLINTATNNTSFVITDNNLVRRIQYNSLKSSIAADIGVSSLAGPTGPTGPASSIAGPTGPTGAASNVSGPTGATGPTGANGFGIPVGGLLGQSLVKLSNTNYDIGWQTISGGGGVGVGLGTRTSASGATALLASGASENVSITGFKSYMLLKVVTNYPAWVRIYSDTAARSADASRSQLNDPLPGAGVIAEVITISGELTQLITPAVVGFNNDSTPGTTIYLNVTNNDSVSRSINVTLTLLQLES